MQSKSEYMAYKHLRMDTINLIRNLRNQGVGKKAIARQLHISKNTVKKYLLRIDQMDIDPKISELEENHAQNIYSTHYFHASGKREELLSVLPELVKELRYKGVTRQQIWEQYRINCSNGYSYGQFCRELKKYKRISDATIAIEHEPGQVMQTDFAGSKLRYFDNEQQQWVHVPVLISTLPCSGRIHVMALPSFGIEDLTRGMSCALRYFGGVPKLILSDNMASFVSKADRYSPTFTQLCRQLSVHYGTELDATRVGKPQDKGHVERHVKTTYQNIYAKIRHETAYSLEQLNQFVSDKVNALNNTVRQGTEMTRNEYFERYEADHLLALPFQDFEITKSTRATVQRNYHVLIGEDKHYYSVPYKYIGQRVDIIYTKKDVEIYLGVHRIAFHARNLQKGGFSTTQAHRPEKHKMYLAQLNATPQDYLDKAAMIGPDTLWAVENILNAPNHPRLTKKQADGVFSLVRHYSDKRIEQVCTYIKPCGTISLEMIKNVLASNMDAAAHTLIKPARIPLHENIRGATHYQ